MLLIYGSTGYTGRLIVAEALARGLRPTLAARNADAVRAQAEQLGLDWRVAPLDDAARLDAALAGARVVLHCAGPFARTWRPIADACLRARAHYLDITGEIGVLEGLAGRAADARAAGVMLLPGVGFDVVPSDCLAAHLKARLPGATHLALAFHATGGASRGTLLTMVAGLGEPGAVRRDGRIVPVPQGWRSRRVDFGDGVQRNTMSIGWGDISTAYHSTGIPNIDTYATAPPALRLASLASQPIAAVLRSGLVRGALERVVRSRVSGPSDGARARGASLFWGEAVAPDGARAVSRARTASGYAFTAQAAVHIAQKALAGNAPPGFQTPSRAYGEGLLVELRGATLTDA